MRPTRGEQAGKGATVKLWGSSETTEVVALPQKACVVSPALDTQLGACRSAMNGQVHVIVKVRLKPAVCHGPGRAREG